MMQRLIASAGIVLLVAALPLPASAGPFNFTSFDGPGNNGGGTTVNGINNAGDVVGFSSDNAATPTLFTNFIRNPDGTFSPLSIGGDPLAMANGINDARTVVGGSSNGTAFTLPSGGTPTTLPAVNTTTTSQTAFGINQSGLIVGQFTDNATGNTPGYLLSGGTYTILTPTPTALVTNAQGVNNNGLVIGFYSTDGAHQHGFIYNSTTKTFTLVPDPSIANLFLTQFLGVNDNGLAVGYYQTADGSQHGFLFNIATDAYTFLDDPFAAISGLSITQITGVNDLGDIAGFYVDATTGLQRGFVAAPAPVTVPEPASLGLMLSGLLLMRVLGRRSRPWPELSSDVEPVAPLAPVAQGVDQQGEGRRGLASAGIVEVIARKRRAPIFQHPLEAALGEMRLRQILRHIGEAESGERRIEHLGSAVEDELAFDAHLELAAILLELPGVEPAMGGQAQIDAAVTDQVLRPLRLRPLAEIGWRPHDRHAHVGPDAHGDHVLRHLLAAADAGVETLGDDVRQPGIVDDLDFDVRVSAQEFRELRPEERVDGIFGGGDPDRAGGLLAKLAQG